MALKKDKRYKPKGYNIFNKRITENFPNLGKVLPIQVQKAFRTQNRLEQNRTSTWHIIIKTTSTDCRERKLKAVREEKQITYKCKPMKKQHISQWKP
jgi:hypothetical protein